MQKFKAPEGHRTSQSAVSLSSTGNPTMNNPSVATGGDKFTKNKREKFLLPLEGHGIIIDLTSEDTYSHSTTLRRMYHERADAGQLKEDVNMKRSQWSLSENSKPEVKADDKDALFHVWDDMGRAMKWANHDMQEPIKNVISVKRRKLKSDDDVSHSLSNDCSLIPSPSVDMANVLQVKPIAMCRPKKGRGPRKRDSSQVECRDVLHTGFERSWNIDHAAKQEVFRMEVDLHQSKDTNAGKGDEPRAIQQDRKVTEKRQNSEELLEVEFTEMAVFLQQSQEEKAGKGDGHKERQPDRKVRDKPQNVEELMEDEVDEIKVDLPQIKDKKAGKGDGHREIQPDRKVTEKLQNVEELIKDEVDKMEVDLQQGKNKKAGKGAGRRETQPDKKVREKRKNAEELLEDEVDEEEGRPAKPKVDDLSEELLKLSSKVNDEKVDYEPYVRRNYKEVEDEVEPEFDKLKICLASISGPSADTMTTKTSQKGEGECEHKNFDFDDHLGFYCGDCGTAEIEMPASESSPQKRSCAHKNFDYWEESGKVCLDCGKVLLDVGSCCFAGDRSNGSRKQTQRVQEIGDGISQVKLNLQGTTSATDLCGVDLQLHPFYEEKMHPHQKKGFQFLAENLLVGQRKSNEQMGCVLAHAPGTGKTFLLISFIQSFLAKFPEGKPMILAPKSILHVWENEFENWKVQEVPIYKIGGSGSNCPGDGALEEDEDARLAPHAKNTLKERRAIKLREWQAGRGVLLMSPTMFANLVTNGLRDNVLPESLDYQMSKVLLGVSNLVILDEGHFARNNNTDISKALLAMETKRKVVLSGTLFQNNFKELYTLLKLCRDDFMMCHPQYRKRIAELAAYNNGPKHGNGSSSLLKMQEIMQIEERIFTEEIGKKLEQYMQSDETGTDEIELVLLKLQSLTPFVDFYPGEILKSLPGLHEYSVHLNLTELQQQTIAGLPKSNHMSRQCGLLAACIHPSLAHKAEGYLAELKGSAASCQTDAHHGVKITFILQLLAHCKQAKEKLLIFCSFLYPLHYIEALFCKVWDWQSGKHILCLNGEMADSDRQRVILEFNDFNSPSQVLLASTKACKEGITLVGASRVVILDSSDNPSVVRQAVSRAFRIGQKKKVYVYRLVAEHKEEAFIFNRSVNKERLSQVLLDPVATMARLRGFLQGGQTPADIEDDILQKMMLNDRANGGWIHEVKKYNATG